MTGVRERYYEQIEREAQRHEWWNMCVLTNKPNKQRRVKIVNRNRNQERTKQGYEHLHPMTEITTDSQSQVVHESSPQQTRR